VREKDAVINHDDPAAIAMLPEARLFPPAS
jgi:hypothetical protein